MTNPVFTRIEDLINNNDIVLFMKGTPEMPACGFSSVVVKVMQLNGVKFASFNVMEDAEMRQGIKDYANWPTIPQVYVKGEFIGGCDILREMHESGEFKELLDTAGIKRAES